MIEYNPGVNTVEQRLILRTAGVMTVFLMGCQPVVAPVASLTHEPTPQQSPLGSPQTPLGNLLNELTLRYGSVQPSQPNRIVLVGGNDRRYTLVGSPDFEGMFVLMERRRSDCGLAGADELKAFGELKKKYRKLDSVDTDLIRRAMDRLTSCIPFMEKQWKSRHIQGQPGN